MAKQLTREPEAPADELYERDFHAWALRQAELVRSGRLAELDLENVAEELESLGKEQAHKLKSSFLVPRPAPAPPQVAAPAAAAQPELAR